MKKIPLISALLLLVALLPVVISCGSGRNKACHELWTLSRAVLNESHAVKDKGEINIIDSLQQVGSIPDTVAMLTALDVAQDLFEAHDYSSTIRYVYEAERLLNSMVEHEHFMRSNLIGLKAFANESFHAMSLNDRAVQGYLKDLPVAKQLQLKESLAFLYNNLGSVYIDMGNYDKAITMLHESIKWNRELADSSFLAYNYNNLSAAYQHNNNPEKAIEYGFVGLHYLSADDTLTIMTVKRNIAGRYALNDEFSSALKLLTPALDYFESTANRQELAVTYKDLATIQWRMGNLAAARGSFEKAFDNINFCKPSEAMTVARQYANFCDSIGDQAHRCSALAYCLKLNDSMQNADGGAGDAITQLYQLEEERGDTNNKIYRHNLSKLLVYLSIAITVLVVALVALWWTRRRDSRQERKLQAKIEELQQQLMGAAVENERNESLVAQLSNELQALQRTLRSGSQGDAMTHLRHITAQVMQAGNQGDNQAIASANADFFQRLLTRFPSLTQSDLRLCALLRQGLSSKEIASITGREVRSVETARNRLRKKCDLPQGEDLFRYFLEV